MRLLPGIANRFAGDRREETGRRATSDVANSIANSMDSMEADVGRFRGIVDPRATVYERRTWKSEKNHLESNAIKKAIYRKFYSSEKFVDTKNF